MKTKEMTDDLKCVLDLNRHIVGVKFIFTKEEFDSINVDRVKYKLSYCNMVKFATKGRCLKANLENFLCSGSITALGLREPDSAALSGKIYHSFNIYDSLCTAKEVRKDATYLNQKTYGVLVMPLERFETDPDTVLIIANPYQSMRIIQGYNFHYGAAKNIKMIGNSGICSGCTAAPYDNNDLNVSLLCSNSRFTAKWNDNELGVGLPFNVFERLYDGIMKTIDPCEPDERKLKMMERCKKAGRDIDINMGKSYYKSSFK